MKQDKKLDALIQRHSPIFTSGYTVYDVAKKYGISPGNAGNILNAAVKDGRAEVGWKRIGTKWYRAYQLK